MTRTVILVPRVLVVHLFLLHVIRTSSSLTVDTVESVLEEDYYLIEAIKTLEEYARDSDRRLNLVGDRRREAADGISDETPTSPMADRSGYPIVHNYSKEFLAAANDYNITNRVLDIFFNTQYCGPGSVSRGYVKHSSSRDDARQMGRLTYADLDSCCKMHDECPKYITRYEDYASFPGLEYRSQYFTRCDPKNKHRI